jgi:phosphoribosylformimino-5-aminoimidazole carboxamide ribotide isomerase
MLVIPAIDLQDGKCVRLVKGKIEEKTIYYDDPLVPARDFLNMGAEIIHIIDLDGAYGRGNNFESIKRILNNCPVKLQVGGGIRSVEKAEKLINMGVERVICGTAAIKNPDFVPNLGKIIGSEHLMIALDHRKGKVLTHGWQKDTELDVFEWAKIMEKKGAGFILFSSAEVDGTLMGPDIENTSKMVETISIPVVAAGGMSSMNDIQEIQKTGVYGIVIGKAIYEGTIDLKKALKK